MVSTAVQHYHTAQAAAQEHREKEWDSAVRLQAWWRMHMAIKRIVKMQEAARSQCTPVSLPERAQVR